MMTPAEYQRACLRTVSRADHFWDPDFSGSRESSRFSILNNCALGMAGEATEIAETPDANEIGDGYWYAFVMLKALDVEPQAYPTGMLSADDAQHALWFHAGKACEWVKKVVFHHREYADYRAHLIEAVMGYCEALASLDVQEPGVTFQQNIDKLRKRWPGEFLES